jgi:UDP-glucose 4-epimerase
VRHGGASGALRHNGGAIYGEQQVLPTAEDYSRCPISPYGVSKLAAERYLYYYHVQYGISCAVLRYARTSTGRVGTRT